MMRHPPVDPQSLEPAGYALPCEADSSTARAAVSAAASASNAHLAALSIALAWLLFWYRDTVMSMVDIWSRSGTFTHGYLVAPISAWLVWRHRHHLRGVPVAPSGLGILTGLVVGFAWLLGELASVDSVSQFALVGMVVSLVWAVMGTAVLRSYAFPLAFLVFLVPFGEFLFPMMMDWTADFVIWALRTSGVPVYAEGRSLVIPSGQWQVVEGCSGVRYLIASAVVGSLYAYLNYRSLHRRLIFIAVSVVLPVFGNWVRAWGIVMLGHYSGNKLATGVDHLVYGWVFFGMIMLALFWIGARWQEGEAPAPVPIAGATSGAGLAKKSALVWIALALLAVLAWKPLLHELERRGQHGPVQFAELSVPGWQAAELTALPQWAPRYEGMRGVLRTAFASGGNMVGVHIAYYRDQQPGEELINSVNRILLNKDPLWTMASYGSKKIALDARPLTILSTEIRNPADRLLVWHWYWIGGRWTSSDYLAKAYLALAQLAGRGDDSALVAIYVPTEVGESVRAEETLAAFLAAAGPSLAEVLQQAMER